MVINRMDHVGINVQDLDAAIAFFQDLGLELLGTMEMAGELVEKIIGLQQVKDTIAMLKIPDGPTVIELVQFHSPVDEKGVQESSPHTLGIRHLCFNVSNLDEIVALLQKKHGATLVGEIMNYNNMYKLCYMRGPEGIIVELAEPMQEEKSLW